MALDTTMIFTGFWDHLAPFPDAALPLARDLGLAGKVLLGSDFPNIPHPYPEALEALERTGLGTAWVRAVCHDNAARLLSL